MSSCYLLVFVVKRVLFLLFCDWCVWSVESQIKNRGFDMWSSSSTSVGVRWEPSAGFWHFVIRLGGPAGRRLVRDVVSPWRQGLLLFVPPPQQAVLPPLYLVLYSHWLHFLTFKPLLTLQYKPGYVTPQEEVQQSWYSGFCVWVTCIQTLTHTVGVRHSNFTK